jgi:hypothetical protein
MSEKVQGVTRLLGLEQNKTWRRRERRDEPRDAAKKLARLENVGSQDGADFHHVQDRLRCINRVLEREDNLYRNSVGNGLRAPTGKMRRRVLAKPHIPAGDAATVS